MTGKGSPASEELNDTWRTGVPLMIEWMLYRSYVAVNNGQSKKALNSEICTAYAYHGHPCDGQCSLDFWDKPGYVPWFGYRFDRLVN